MHYADEGYPHLQSQCLAFNVTKGIIMTEPKIGFGRSMTVGIMKVDALAI
ncbi:Uncharacterized protein YR821_2206 [Yersinia ruckeri]|nr:hypothetical protein yruck0001_11010 [Yersinia ruckeri ATCC 29473]QTD77125.1 Uncharacterized protein YR821_2206 [Yersinia ruckeri]